MGEEHVAALRATAICRGLSAPEIETIAAIAERREVAAGKELFREGEPGDGLYLIVSGEIDVIKRTPAGERSLAQLRGGEVLGEISLLTSEARSATGRATVPTSVLRLPATRFRKLLEDGAPAALKLAAALAEVLARRLAATNARMLDLAAPEGGRAERAGLKTEELAELHRALQVWSF